MKNSKIPKNIRHTLWRAGAIALSLLGLANTSTWAGNVLGNPGFETGSVNAPWNKYGVFDLNTSANVYYNGCNCGSNVWIYDGTYSGKTYGQFTGGDNYNGVFQDVSAAPTAVYTADVWTYNSTQDHIAGAIVAWLEVHFMDAANNTLALYQSAQITPATLPLDAWVDYPVTNQISPVVGTVSTLVAPAGTAKVRYQIVFHQPPGYDGGSVYWDDCTLNEVSGPVPPTIKNVYPDGTVLLQGVTNALTFTVQGAVAITNVQVILNGTDVSSSLVITGSSTNKSVSYPGLQTNNLYTFAINATDSNGITSSASGGFDTFNPNNFTWEAEDWDFNGGQYIDNPALPSTSNTPTNSYYNQGVGAVGIDYQDTDAAGTHAYRPVDQMATEVTSDQPRQRWLNGEATDPSIKDYDVGWFNPGEWCNYTRTYPTGVFNVYARMSSPASSVLTLSRVTNGWGTASQGLQTLGTFSLLNGLGWGTYSWVPLADSAGNMVKVTLSGTNTLRATTAGNNNMQFFMLVPANTNLPVISGVYPDGSTLLQATNKFSFTANSVLGINPASITVTLSVTNQTLHYTTNLTSTNGLTIGGSSTSRQVAYPGLLLNTLYTAVIHVTDTGNNSVSTTVRFDTFNPAFTWEGEDWDYNSGQFVDPYTLDCYATLQGDEGIDFHDNANGGGTPYRPGSMSADVANDTPRAPYVAASAVDYSLGFFSLSATAGNEWVNYTRRFPAGTYNVYGRFAAGGGTSGMELARVTGGWGTSSQTLQDLGSFTVASTGGWSTYGWTPLRDAYGNLAQVTLSSTNTLRVSRTNGADANINFYMLLPAENDLPTITQVYPNAPMQSTNRLTFTVNGPTYAVASANVKVTLNGVDVSSKLVFTGSPSSWSVSLPGALAPNTVYTAVITVTDSNGTTVSSTANFDTFSASGFVWETEDYDYGGGQFIDNPQTNAYANLTGTEGIDFHKLNANGTHAYRSGDAVATELCGDFVRPQFTTGGADYDMGFTGGGEWENYTRHYPPGTYNVYARMARGTSGTGVMGMSKVTSGWGTTNQTAASLGTFSLGFSGGWQSYTYVPLKDTHGNLSVVTLAGSTNTLRFTDGGANITFFTLTPALVLQASLSGGQLALAFGTQQGFNYTVQSKSNLTDTVWAPVGSTLPGDGTTKTVNAPTTGGKGFYRLQVN